MLTTLRNWLLRSVQYDEDYMIPDPDFGWDDYSARLFRYYHYRTYYENSTYRSIHSYSLTYKQKNKTYKGIRPIYNPVYRLVNLYGMKMYPGKIDWVEMNRGALPFTLRKNDNTLMEPLRDICRWSNIRQFLTSMVKNGIKFGDFPIKIVDKVDSISFENIHPSKVKAVEIDSMGIVKRIKIEYERSDDSNADYKMDSPINEQQTKDNFYTYTEIITEESFETFKDGEPFAFYEDSDGKKVKRWPNPYGFVPVVFGKYKDEDNLKFGINGFHSQVTKIDELNSVASEIYDQVGKIVTPLWYFSGARRNEKLDVESDDKNKVAAIYGPKDSKPHPMIADLPIGDALTAMGKLIDELEKDLPELALHQLRGKSNVSAVSVYATYSDAVTNMETSQGIFDDPLVRAFKMALAIGAYRGLDNFRKLSLNSYKDGSMEFGIGARPVVDDVLSQKDRVTMLIQSRAPQSAIWKEMEYSDSTVDEWKTIQKTEQMEQLEFQQMQVDMTQANAGMNEGNDSGTMTSPSQDSNG